MKRLWVMAAAAGLAWACPTGAKGEPGESAMEAEAAGCIPKHIDAQVTREMIRSNSKRLALGFLALYRGRSPEVIRLGFVFIDNAIRANKELVILANQLDLHGMNEEIMASFTEELEPLQRVAKGEGFDRALVQECLAVTRALPAPHTVRHENLKQYLVKMSRVIEAHQRRLLRVGDRLGMSETELRAPSALRSE